MKYILMSLLTLASFVSFAQDKQPVQCKGTTVKNQQCARAATEGTKDNSYCTQHNPDRLHCAGTTSKGQPCKRTVQKAGDKCRDHYFQKNAAQ